MGHYDKEMAEERSNSLASMERPTSRLDSHRSELEQLNNHLERACSQLEAHLGKFRGHQPEEATGKAQGVNVDPPLADYLDQLTESAMNKVSHLNSMAEELGGFI